MKLAKFELKFDNLKLLIHFLKERYIFFTTIYIKSNNRTDEIENPHKEDIFTLLSCQYFEN